MKLHALLFIILPLVTCDLYAQVSVSLSAHPGRCPSSGSISVAVTGASGSVLYAIKKSTETSYSPEQSGNVFSNLGNGTYSVAVHDATGITISAPVTLSNAPYTVMSFSAVLSGNVIVTGCAPDGSIELTVLGGRPPYTYVLRNGPTLRPPVVDTLATRVRFTQLESGTYFIDVTDSCRNILTQSSSIVVNSLFNLKDTLLGSADGLSGPTVWGGNCADSISFATNNLTLKGINGTLLFDRNGKHMPNGYPIEAQVEYPAGSGIFTAWQSIFSKFALPNYSVDSTQNQFRVRIKHPCNDTNIVTTPVYTIPYPFQTRSSFCAPSLVRTTPGYLCGPVQIRLVDRANSSHVLDYIWNGTGTSYTFDTTGWGTATFKVFVTSGAQSYQTNTVIASKAVSVSVAADSWDFLSNTYCDFTTGRLRSYMSGFPVDNTVPITYSIVSGPVMRDPVTALQPLQEFIWDTLPAGNYTIKVDYGGCRSETITRTITLPYSGFGAEELSYRIGASCGRYVITGLGWYILPLGGPLNDTLVMDTLGAATNLYSARFINPDGSLGTVSPNAISGTPFAITGREVGPGTYRIAFLSKHSSDNKCYYLERSVTIPPYLPVDIDASKSGGVSCGSSGDIIVGTNNGTIYIGTNGSSLRPFSYRLKLKNQPDNTYSPWQSSPVFENRAIGVYTAQVFDSCGYTATGDVELLGVDTASAIRVQGATVSGSAGTICQYATISLELRIVGQATNVKWVLPSTGDTVAAPVYSIEQFSSVDAGKYYVTFFSGGCTRKDSVVLSVQAAPEFAADNEDSVCFGTPVDLATMVSNVTVNSVAKYFTDSAASIPLLSPVVVPDSSTRYYVQSYDSVTTCKSLVVPLLVVEKYRPELGTLVAPPGACAGQPLVVTKPIVLPRGSTVTSDGWTLNGLPFDPLTGVSVADNGKLLRYFISSDCGDSITAPVTISVAAYPSFDLASPDTLAYGTTTDLKDLALTSGDTAGLILVYYDSAYVKMSDAAVAAAGTGLYHVVGTNAGGCSDSSTVRVVVEAVALPVRFLYFRATLNEEQVLLDWATSLEETSDRFDIEVSGDGVHYQVIGTLKAAGNSTLTKVYSFIDRHVFRYGFDRLYYRLKQVDLDGRFAYSTISMVSMASRSGAVEVFPVPFRDELRVLVPGAMGGRTQVKIADMAGRIVYTRVVMLGARQRALTLTGLAGLQKGAYVLTVWNSAGKSSTGILKE